MKLIRLISAAILFVALSGPGFAADAIFPPGVRVGLTPLVGLVPAQGFAGFETEDHSVKVLVTELPAEAYGEVMNAFKANPAGTGGVKPENIETAAGVAYYTAENTKDGANNVRRYSMILPGGTFSGYYVGFGQRKMAGPTAFVDFGSRAPLTFEAEVRWLDLNEIAGVHTTTYLGGPRYSFRQGGRLRPYAKVLLGDGEFSFPYGLAHGSYFVVAPGAGLEYQWNHRVYFRLIDAEYQYWNQFTYGSLPTYGVSSGLRIRIF